MRVFQPAPDPKAGCDWVRTVGIQSHPVFQPSPDPKAGCDRRDRRDRAFPARVSTLTRPEGRVRPGIW